MKITKGIEYNPNQLNTRCSCKEMSFYRHFHDSSVLDLKHYCVCLCSSGHWAQTAEGWPHSHTPPPAGHEDWPGSSPAGLLPQAAGWCACTGTKHQQVSLCYLLLFRRLHSQPRCKVVTQSRSKRVQEVAQLVGIKWLFMIKPIQLHTFRRKINIQIKKLNYYHNKWQIYLKVVYKQNS